MKPTNHDDLATALAARGAFFVPTKMRRFSWVLSTSFIVALLGLLCGGSVQAVVDHRVQNAD